MLLDVSVTHVYKVVITSSILAAKPLADAPLFNRNPTNRRQKTSPNNRPSRPVGRDTRHPWQGWKEKERKGTRSRVIQPFKISIQLTRSGAVAEAAAVVEKELPTPEKKSPVKQSPKKRKAEAKSPEAEKKATKKTPRTRRNERRAKKNSVCFTFFSKRPKEIDRHGLCFVVRFSFNTKHIIIVYILFLCCVV